jgi:hypothetical protein
MEFYIRQGSTEPILKLQMIEDGKNDKSSFNSRLENSIITLDLIDIKTNIPFLVNLNCNIVNRIKRDNFITDEYYIIHKFTSEETNEKGRYEGIINIKFLDNNNIQTDLLILPINEKLFINVI